VSTTGIRSALGQPTAEGNLMEEANSSAAEPGPLAGYSSHEVTPDQALGPFGDAATLTSLPARFQPEIS